jgi:hypothetical protein
VANVGFELAAKGFKPDTRCDKCWDVIKAAPIEGRSGLAAMRGREIFHEECYNKCVDR